MMDEGVLFEGHCAMAPPENTAKPVTLLAGGSK
jgi:hypothetical protein